MHNKNLETLKDFTLMKDKIRMKIGYSLRAREFHEFRLIKSDMKITFYLDLGLKNTPVVTEELVEAWNVTEQELINASLKNEQFIQKPLYSYGNLTTITNVSGINGAVALADLSFWKKVAEERGDFYIIPHSMNDLAIVSKDAMSLSLWEDLIKENNHSELLQGLVLSSHIYTYDREENVIRCADWPEDIIFSEHDNGVKISFSEEEETFTDLFA